MFWREQPFNVEWKYGLAARKSGGKLGSSDKGVRVIGSWR
jgi:hypothetical protein